MPIQLRISLLDQKSVVNKTSLVSFEFFYQYPKMISVHMLVISVVERCFRLGLKYLIPLKKS